MRTRTFIRACFLLVASASIQAQSAGGLDSLPKVVQFSLPATPALDVIGAKAEAISRPTSPREIAAEFGPSIDMKGRLQQGLAVELNPRQLLRPDLDYAAYRSSLKNRLISNATFSVATAAATDSASTNVGVGLRIVFLDKSSPLHRDLRPALLECFRTTPPNATNRGELLRSCAGQALERDRDAHWNDLIVAASIAQGWMLDDSRIGSAAPLTTRASLVTSGPLGKRAQFAAQVSHSRSSAVGDRDALVRTAGGLRVTVGSARFGAFGEYLVARYGASLPSSERTQGDWSLGIESALGKTLWFSVGYGARYDELTADSKETVIAGFRVRRSEQGKLVSRQSEDQ